MSDFIAKMAAGMEKDLLLLQGTAAQSSRMQRRRGMTIPRPQDTYTDSVRCPSILSSHSLHGSLPSSSTTTISTTTSAPSWTEERTSSNLRLRRDKLADPIASPSIPLRLLLPANRSPSSMAIELPRAASYSRSSVLPASPTFGTFASPRTSVNPRFTEAHVEYIGNDCVIHNGMHMVDVALEFAAQRAAPRLVSFPHNA
ncbi:hypothetical protein GGI07_001638 [Coemansia sp. Benny D115]|nr:hypothetical protein GGI07_001638 [Coemansia sp. Benny D115]